MIQDKIFFDEKDPTGVSYNTPFTVYGSYEGRLWSKTPSGTIKYYTQNSDLSVYATTGSNSFNGNQTVTGSLTVTGGITGTATTASYVEYAGVANKPTLVSGSAQIVGYNVFATTGSNQFNGSQAITGSLTVTGQVIAQTLNVQQVTSSIVYSSGSNVFGNSLSNTQQFTGSLQVTGSTHYLLGNVGVGTNSPIKTLDVRGTLAISNNASSYWYMDRDDSDGRFKILTDTNNEHLSITSGGNIGIGLSTASLSDTLTVSRNADNNSGGLTLFNANTSGYGSALTFRVNYAGVYNTSRIHGDWDTGNSGNLYFYTANTSQSLVERMRINGAGNVGIGTTNPVANDGTSRTLQLGNRLTIQNVIGTQFLLGTNVYYDGTWKYIAAAKAQAVRGTGESGAIQFSLSPTGTIGGTVTNMDGSDIKMIILDTGNVGIGTTTPATLLNLKSSTTTELRLESIGGTYRSFIGFRTDGQKYDLGVNLNDTQDALSINYAGAERMRITSGGVINFNNASIYAGAGSINSTVSSESDFVYSGVNTNATNPRGVYIRLQNTINGDFAYYLEANAATKFYVNGNGVIYSTNTSVQGISDVRHKENIRDLDKGLSEILLLKPRLFDWKEGKGTGSKNVMGFIAQEVEDIFPELISDWKETVDATESFKTIAISNIIPYLTKAIQELKSENDTLKSILQRNNIS
jgi:hypothetical protein